MFRVEDKYMLSPNDFVLMKHRFDTLLKPDDFTCGEVGYKISSVYFDDIYDSHLTDTVSGNPIRQKYRIRIYNDSFDTIKLEVKSKQYSRIFKRSKSITYEQLQTLLNGIPVDYGEKTNDLDDPGEAFNTAIKTRLLRPKVIVTYERKAYVNETGNVRITFDENVRGSNRIELFGNPDLVYDYSQEGDSILEVKYDELLPGYIAQTLELNKLWQSSFSKYRICREIYM